MIHLMRESLVIVLCKLIVQYSTPSPRPQIDSLCTISLPCIQTPFFYVNILPSSHLHMQNA